ncbi:metal ABC transporter periplasmic protein [Amycolatopsis mediterranei S699]|uniref:Periplasmic substrate-binding component of ABC-type metal ion transport system n=2 Tax=Amycolatopsis mediterranei TaxID=33910 RepID=A0A0H3DJQ7_AMYMU|nr:zinc ABC transporter substrate-binding protein [Amycolatopsis mediterranei]ADJ50393.1 periplasmic substrate-binding component of ABC-type metal ion transport system [Amycolatopsis mediterranei U32]AEK47394.1 metal ABC transporter periplasmic protein [Amycolatopsis mediterranei S699]AFO82099.1 metal ABC transporter periplasmic protein [Amycolatopsis mediterranei S699]AGT89228.1 metal ABC transporter periplasmic protein [Amycolatopsis mediterranei RB]KDO08221.1 metal ABC transporter substrate
MSSRRTRSVLAAASALSVFALAACSGGGTSSDGGGAQAGGDGKVKVVASTDVWGSVAGAVGGENVEVKSIIHDPSADPHSYETTADDALAAKGAQLLLSNGGGYDEFFGKLTEQAGSAKKLVAYDIAAPGDENEHVWYDLPGVGKVADQLAAQLGELKPAAKQRFADNATAFKVKVDALEKRLEELGTTHPGTKVVVTEPVAHYLLASAKITDATPKAFSDAVENDTDVPADAVSAYKQLIATKQVKALINNAQTVTPLTQDVVGQAKAAGIGVVDVTETLPQGVTDYIGWMTGEVDALAGALK